MQAGKGQAGVYSRARQSLRKGAGQGHVLQWPLTLIWFPSGSRTRPPRWSTYTDAPPGYDPFTSMYIRYCTYSSNTIRIVMKNNNKKKRTGRARAPRLKLATDWRGHAHSPSIQDCDRHTDTFTTPIIVRIIIIIIMPRQSCFKIQTRTRYDTDIVTNIYLNRYIDIHSES